MALFAATLFANAALLFSVQPMWTKMVLPLLGGTPNVWNTCLLFFQGALLAGYLYAHLSSRRMTVGTQSAVQVALLLVAALSLPIAVRHGSAPPAGTPTLWLTVSLTISIGAPFFVLSTGAPLLQRWFSRTDHPHASNPYFLYAASNLGSMVALLAYPFVVEPRITLARQSLLWTGGYAALVALIAVCATVIRRTGNDDVRVAPPTRSADEAEDAAVATGNPSPVTVTRRIRWVLLSLAPSSLLLGLTTFLTTDVSSIPLLWVVPLALYLLTFVLSFARTELVPWRFLLFAQALFVMALVMVMAMGGYRPLTVLAPLHLGAFFLTAWVCHATLARDRPDVEHLTEFYLWISVGGVLGGAFNVLVAPLLFDSVVEYPIALALACALRPSRAGSRENRRIARVLDVVLPLGLGLAVVYALRNSWFPFFNLSARAGTALFALFAVIGLAFQRRALRFGLGVAAIFVGTAVGYGEQPMIRLRDRSFFGVYRVLAYPTYHLLQSGTTTHGAQSTVDSLRLEPLTYYRREGPLGQVFETLAAGEARRSVAVVGLGVGTVACYARPGERWSFYEIDPLVVRIATTPTWFTYLRDCQPDARIVIGDARRSLMAEPDATFDLIILDAFNSDAIPVHLVTREALALYLRKLAPGGMIAFHISNRYVDLAPVLTALALDARLPGVVGEEVSLSAAEREAQFTPSRWVVLGALARDLAPLARRPEWQVLSSSSTARLWTDDYSDVLGVFRWEARR